MFAAAAAFVSTLSSVEAAPSLSATLGSKIDYKVHPNPLPKAVKESVYSP